MNGEELRALLLLALPRLADAKEELRALDAAIGDGDLGITISKGAQAVVDDLAQESGPTRPAEVLKVAARRFASANPSTMSALVAAGLLAAVKRLDDAGQIDRAAAVGMLTAATERIAERGGAEPGDKTLLDALVPSIAVLEESTVPAPQALLDMAHAVAGAVAELSPLQSQRGRAAWVGERSIGAVDGGMVAYQRLLESLAASWPTS